MFKYCMQKSAVLIVSLVIALVIGEVACRYLRFREISKSPQYPEGYLVTDVKKGYDLACNFPRSKFAFADQDEYIWTNELGCFDKPYKGEKDYILLAGDSFVWGFVPYEKRFGNILEQIHSRRVMNCGVSGYGTHQELCKAQEVIAQIGQSPAIIILCYFLENDFLDYFLGASRVVVNGDWVLTAQINANGVSKRDISWAQIQDMANNVKKFGRPEKPVGVIGYSKAYLCRNSALYHGLGLIKGAIRKAVRGVKEDDYDRPWINNIQQWPAHPWLRQGFEEHVREILRFQQLAQQNNAHFLIVIIPPKYLVYNTLFPMRSNEWLSEYNEYFKQRVAQEGVECLDLLPFLRDKADTHPRKQLDSGKDLYWRYDWHFSPRGNRYVASCIAETLIEKKFLPASEKSRSKIESILSEFKK